MSSPATSAKVFVKCSLTSDGSVSISDIFRPRERDLAFRRLRRREKIVSFESMRSFLIIEKNLQGYVMDAETFFFKLSTAMETEFIKQK